MAPAEDARQVLDALAIALRHVRSAYFSEARNTIAVPSVTCEQSRTLMRPAITGWLSPGLRIALRRRPFAGLRQRILPRVGVVHRRDAREVFVLQPVPLVVLVAEAAEQPRKGIFLALAPRARTSRPCPGNRRRSRSRRSSSARGRPPAPGRSVLPRFPPMAARIAIDPRRTRLRAAWSGGRRTPDASRREGPQAGPASCRARRRSCRRARPPPPRPVDIGRVRAAPVTASSRYRRDMLSLPCSSSRKIGLVAPEDKSHHVMFPGAGNSDPSVPVILPSGQVPPPISGTQEPVCAHAHPVDRAVYAEAGIGAGEHLIRRVAAQEGDIAVRVYRAGVPDGSPRNTLPTAS